MSKKVLILSGSPRKNGNSDLLCDEFMRGVTESGNEAEKIRIAGKKWRFVGLVYWKLYCHYFTRMGRHIISSDTLRLSMNAARLWTAFAKTRFAQTQARCRH